MEVVNTGGLINVKAYTFKHYYLLLYKRLVT